jgi:hypothetical protein
MEAQNGRQVKFLISPPRLPVALNALPARKVDLPCHKKSGRPCEGGGARARAAFEEVFVSLRDFIARLPIFEGFEFILLACGIFVFMPSCAAAIFSSAFARECIALCCIGFLFRI